MGPRPVLVPPSQLEVPARPARSQATPEIVNCRRIPSQRCPLSRCCSELQSGARGNRADSGKHGPVCAVISEGRAILSSPRDSRAATGVASDSKNRNANGVGPSNGGSGEMLNRRRETPRREGALIKRAPGIICIRGSLRKSQYGGCFKRFKAFRMWPV